MITIYVDSFYTASEVHKFIRNSLNTYGYISLGDILHKAGWPHTTWTYDSVLFHEELKKQEMLIVPAYIDKTKPHTLVIPSDRYTMMFNCINKNDSTAKHSAFVPKCTPIPTNYLPEIRNVKFNGPATIVFWADGTKTVVKCQDGDAYSEEVGLAMCIIKKVFGNTSKYNDIFKKWCPSYDTEPDAYDCLSEACKQIRDHVLKTFNEII